jgi:glutathione synthase/RimK-type ligase-like ATP-grasp enzyme
MSAKLSTSFKAVSPGKSAKARKYARPCKPMQAQLPFAPMASTPDLIVIHEHPEWQKPLFAALARRGVAFEPYDVTRAAFSNLEAPRAPLYFNQASPSAYVRGNTRAVPLALAYMRTLERLGARVLNGADVFALELSKSVQATLLRTLDIDTPRSITFNEPSALRGYADRITWPALLKPDQGGSGARIQVVESIEEVEAIFQRDPSIWQPDNLFLLQEYLPHDPEQGIVRLEFLGGELLYAMRVKTHGRFNLCPSPVCNPDEGDGICEIPAHQPVEAPPVEFFPYREVPREAVETARRIVQAARIDVGGIEYLETPDGRRVFYDINANSNLRPSVAQEFGGFDPFERVVDYLVAQIRKRRA